ncbi:MAG TPA: hypothetical protein VMY17_02895 [Thermoplasmata archaeon]|jgi:ribonuclease P protein subunit RPR2|nr:hypothetical protein [Thermoplasmata archaeon]HUS56946.1 hypothetical protein [Thermoplasmata archaeon]
MARRHISRRDGRDIADDRIARLFELARLEAVSGREERARRYVSLALRVGERYKVPASRKRTYCSSCKTFFVPPRNVRVRTGSGRLSITCLACGHIQRYPLADAPRK